MGQSVSIHSREFLLSHEKSLFSIGFWPGRILLRLAHRNTNFISVQNEKASLISSDGKIRLIETLPASGLYVIPLMGADIEPQRSSPVGRLAFPCDSFDCVPSSLHLVLCTSLCPPHFHLSVLYFPVLFRLHYHITLYAPSIGIPRKYRATSWTLRLNTQKWTWSRCSFDSCETRSK